MSKSNIGKTVLTELNSIQSDIKSSKLTNPQKKKVGEKLEELYTKTSKQRISKEDLNIIFKKVNTILGSLKIKKMDKFTYFKPLVNLVISESELEKRMNKFNQENQETIDFDQMMELFSDVENFFYNLEEEIPEDKGDAVAEALIDLYKSKKKSGELETTDLTKFREQINDIIYLFGWFPIDANAKDLTEAKMKTWEAKYKKRKPK